MNIYRPVNVRQDELIRSALYDLLENVERDIIWYQTMTHSHDSSGFYAKVLCGLESDRYQLNCLLDRNFKAPFVSDHSGRFLFI